MDLNVNTGEWTAKKIGVSSDGKEVELGSECKNKSTIRFEDITDVSTIKWDSEKKLTYSKPGADGVRAIYDSNNVTVKNSAGDAVYTVTDGYTNIVDTENVKEYLSDGILADGSGSSIRHGKVVVPDNGYSYSFTDGNILLAQDGDCAAVASDGGNMVTAELTSPTALQLSADGRSEVTVMLSDITEAEENSGEEDDYLLVSMNMIVDTNAAKVALSGNRLTIDSPVEQRFTIHIESPDGEADLRNVTSDILKETDLRKAAEEGVDHDYGNDKPAEEVIPVIETKTSDTFTVGSDTYTVSWNKYVGYDGRKHFGIGADTSWNAEGKSTSSKVYDIKVIVTKNGELIDPKEFTVKAKNNKLATVSTDGITELKSGTKKPIFSIKFRGKNFKDVNKTLKGKTFEFGIMPAELKQNAVTFTKVKTGKDGKVSIKGITFKPESSATGSAPKDIKLKYKKNEAKTDYTMTENSDGSITVTGKNNFYGSVIYTK